MAAALARNPDALTEEDLKNPRITDFFQGQSLTSGSSGWLAEAYERDQSKVDGIINYESVLLSSERGRQTFRAAHAGLSQGRHHHGRLSVDAAQRGEAVRVRQLVAYLRSKDFQTKMSERTLRRPVNADATIAAAIPKRTLIELPFPGQAALIDSAAR